MINSPPNTPPNTDRLDVVHTLRGLASFAVCWFHLSKWFNFKYAGQYPLVEASGHWGWLGVEVFFVISGFILPYSMWRAGYRPGDFFTFVWKRLLRLEPPYLISILLCLLLGFVPTLNPAYRGLPFTELLSAPQLFAHLGYLNAFFGYEWVNPVYWTLAIEFQFYLLVALLFPLLLVPRKSLLVVAALSAAALVVASSHYIFYFLPLFMMGVLIFQYKIGILRLRLFLLSLAPLVALSFFRLGMLETLAGLLAVLVITCVRHKSRVGDFLGDISYSLYLLHMPVGQMVISVGHKLARSEAESYVWLLASVVASIGAAYAFYRLVERPSQARASKIRYRKKSAAMPDSLPTQAVTEAV